jgi:hypothetical protein
MCLSFLKATHEGLAHGVVLWIDYDLGTPTTPAWLSSGPEADGAPSAWLQGVSPRV